MTDPAFSLESRAGGLSYRFVIQPRGLMKPYESCILYFELMLRPCSDFLNKAFRFPQATSLKTASDTKQDCSCLCCVSEEGP